MTAFVDARTGELPETLTASIAVIGSGAAGITLARELAGHGRDVLLVESGGPEIEGQTQALYTAPNVGIPYYDLASCRLRYFGGTTNHWGGFCRANDPIDYVGRPEIGLPAWPISHETLAPYIARAARILEIDTKFFDPQAQLRARGLTDVKLIDQSSQVLETKIFQIAQNIRFGPRFRAEIAANPNIRPVEHLNVIEIVLDEAGQRVDHLVAVTLDGKKFTIKADRFVLCCHAIENARLLLASNARMPAGIGNQSDMVGRHFMEHTHLFASRFIPSDKFPMFYNREFLDRFHLNANLSISESAMREHGIMNYYCRFNPVDTEPLTQHAVWRLRRRFWEPASADLYDDIATILSDFGGAVREAVINRGDETHPRYYRLEHRIEQFPNPDSRVRLTDKKDKLGLRTIEVNWAFTDQDVKTLNTGQRLLAQELSALQLGRVEIEDIDVAMLRERALGHYHHIGTTRMAVDPAHGVVDINLKVHGVDNLFVGGSSVFPSAGYSGPTMMLIGMATRLADHLAGVAS